MPEPTDRDAVNQSKVLAPPADHRVTKRPRFHVRWFIAMALFGSVTITPVIASPFSSEVSASAKSPDIFQEPWAIAWQLVLTSGSSTSAGTFRRTRCSHWIGHSHYHRTG